MGCHGRHGWRYGLTALALLVALVASATSTDPALGVVGGTVADARDWPHTVALLDASEPDPARAQFCGGALVRPQWVLTAAHCVEMDGRAVPAHEVHVARGTRLSALTGASRVSVTRVVRHPLRRASGGPARGHDLALLRLERPLRGAVARLPVSRRPSGRADGSRLLLAHRAETSSERPALRAVLAGWGGADARSTPSDTLRAGRVSVLGADRCQDLGGAFDTICATRPGSREPAACPGDSGGPLVSAPGRGRAGTLIGVVSTGAGHCLRGATAAYTDLGLYTDWVANVAGGGDSGVRGRSG